MSKFRNLGPMGVELKQSGTCRFLFYPLADNILRMLERMLLVGMLAECTAGHGPNALLGIVYLKVRVVDCCFP